MEYSSPPIGDYADRPDKQSMDPELVDRIYESSLVPERWPGVLDELAE